MKPCALIKKLLLPLAASSLLCQAPAHASLLAYEGFIYPVGTNLVPLNLAALSGGTGWSNSWIDVAGNGGAKVNPGNLLAGNHAPPGYDARSADNSALISSDNRYGRWLDSSMTGNFAAAGLVDAHGNIGADGTTLYISFLQQPSSASTFYEFEFHRGDLGDPGRIAGIGNDFNSTTVNFRAPNTTQTPMGPGATNINLYVVRIDFKPGNDDVYVYRDPTGDSEADNEPTLTMLGVADMSFNGISLAAFNNAVTVKYDEIRLGQTWGDVLGGPPLFALQPTNENSYVGQTATFTALAQSALPLSYQWYRGTNLVAGGTSSNLSLSNLQLADAAAYSVVVSNALGMATSAVAMLSVQAVSISVTATSLTVGPGSNLQIAATYGGAQPASFLWFKDGSPIADATNATFSLTNANFFDAGRYVLVASNAYGSATSEMVTVSANLGGILAYEGFAYAPGTGNLPGENGGIGWAGPWANIGGQGANIIPGSLSASTNGPSGYDSHSLSNAVFQSNASRSGRFLDCTASGNLATLGYVDGNGHIGADGKTIYISFLQQPTSTGQFYEFEFHRGNLGDPGRVAGIGNDVGDSDVHFRVESPEGGSSVFWDLGPGSTNVNLYVIRIDYHTGNDTVHVYRNPTGAYESNNVPAATINGLGDMSFDGISFAAYLNNLAVAHDEVRVGQTWADVVGKSVSMLQLAKHANGGSTLRLAASPDYAYDLQGTQDPGGPWTNITRLIEPAVGVGIFTETNLPDNKRFYRAVSEPMMPVTPPANTVIADFEGPTYGAWVTTGTAFGSGPAQGTLPNQNPVTGYLGLGLVDSYNGGDSSTGTLTSPPFTITAHYINFLIGGGNYPGQECINLLVNGGVVRTATGANSETLLPTQWDVSAYQGQSGVLQIVDAATGSWGHINIDEIAMTDAPFPILSRQIVLTNSLLNLPAKNGAPMRRVTVTAGGNTVRDFNMELADGTPDWWAYVDVSAIQGQSATVTVNSLPSGSTALSAIEQSNNIVSATNLYIESLRPQIHYSTPRGWLNDANGMVYYHGQYHLYYQLDPFNWDGSGQKYWGHAVSTDLVRWQELPVAIYSHTYGDDVWSGSTVIDTANTGGFKTGTNAVIVAAYYSTARSECVDYSNDGGLTFTDYASNPVVVINGRDPHMLWYAPSNYWVMAVYDSDLGGVKFYTTPDFHQWTYRSGIAGFFECPDLFQLPVDGNANNMVWELNDASSGYMLGQFNGVTFTPTTAKLPGNNGVGYYASQTFTAMPPGDTRRVRMGWAQISMPGMPFNQMMYFPTVLSLKTESSGVRLCSQPIAEITNLCENEYSWTNLTLIAGSNPLFGIRGTLFNVVAQFVPGTQEIDFTVQGLTVAYHPAAQQITCNGVSNPLPPINGVVQLQFIVDRTSIEIFGNNGQLYMPLPASYPVANGLISLTCQGGSATFNSLTVDKLKSGWAGSIPPQF